MSIEISDRQYWKRLNWYDGLLYLSLLNIDGKNNWRYPKSVEFFQPDIWYGIDSRIMKGFLQHKKHYVIPVRDL